MKNIDLNTFGSSPAAIKLAEMINEQEYNPRRVSNILNSFNSMIYHTNSIDVTAAIHIMRLVYEDSIKKCNSLDAPFDSYTKNVLNTSYKLWHKRKNTQQPRKNRKL